MKTETKTPLRHPDQRVTSPLPRTPLLLFGVALAFTLLVQPALATVTVEGWWHLDSTQPITDASGKGRTFSSAYSTAPAAGGQFAALVVNNGAGGPLGPTAYLSTQAIQVGVGVGGKRQSAMWNINYNPPATNYGIEIWVLPQDNGIAGGSGGWILSSGQAGGVAFRINAPGGTDSYIDAFVLGSGDPIGEQVPIDTTQWMHLALVNDNGVVTFYTNGVACGASVSSGLTAPAGEVYCGTPSDNQAYYGYLDEARMFTFAPGAFSTNDLLLRPPGPNIVGQPQSASVWNGGAATFTVNPSYDASLLYQWRRGGADVGGQTTASYYLNTLNQADNASAFDCIVTGNGISKTSAPPAILTMVAPNPADVAAYRNAVNAEASLLAYFPVDSNTAATLTNTKDGTHNGTLELGATYDGRTNTTFGARSLSFNLDGDVQIPSNPAFEFAGGNGTIEALVYLSQGTATSPTIFSLNYDGGAGPYYALGVSANGNSLTYSNDTTGLLAWAVPGGMIGKLAHVAVVIDHGVNVTAYVNGQNLGTKIQTGFGTAAGAPAWIGGIGTSTTGNRWAGTVDELAIYGSALSEDTIQIHYSTIVYGTNTSAPSIVGAPADKTVYAGASPILLVQAAGTLPLKYQWSTNSVAIAGATSPALAVSNITTTTTYNLKVQNAYGTANTNIVVTVTAPPAGYPATVMTDHPTALWRLSDGAGQPAQDSAGFNDGAYNASGVTYSAVSIPGETSNGGTAVTLDGTAGRAIAPYSASLNPTGPLTVEFWAKLNSYAFYVPVSSMDRPSRPGGYEFYLNGNAPGYEWHTAPGGYALLTAHFTAPTVGTWYHVAGVYDGLNYLLYINGDPADLYIDNPNLEEGGPSPAPNLVKGFYIGSRSDDVRYFNGTLADVAFYNYALSQDQVRKHVFAGLASPIQLTAPARNPNVVVDSKPAGSPHGGVNNGATWAASSSDGTKTRNGVMQFNGTVGNQITLAANPDFGSPVGTVMFWMKSAATVPPGSSGAMLFDRRVSLPNFGSCGDVIYQADDGSITIQPQYYGANVLSAPLSGGSVSDGMWHHVAYVYDQSTTGSITLYVDGAPVGSGTYNASWAYAWPAAQQIELGQSHDSFWERFDGQMDDFRFYSRMLTATEVASVNSSDALVDASTLKVRFNFDAAPGGVGVSWSPGVAVPQTAGAVNGPYVNQSTSRSPLLVPMTATNGFFRAKSP